MEPTHKQKSDLLMKDVENFVQNMIDLGQVDLSATIKGYQVSFKKLKKNKEEKFKN